MTLSSHAHPSYPQVSDKENFFQNFLYRSDLLLCIHQCLYIVLTNCLSNIPPQRWKEAKLPPQNMSLQHIGYFELKVFQKQQVQGTLWHFVVPLKAGTGRHLNKPCDFFTNTTPSPNIFVLSSFHKIIHSLKWMLCLCWSLLWASFLGPSSIQIYFFFLLICLMSI